MPRMNALGKGLGAMFPDLVNYSGDRPSYAICGIEELKPNRFQPRVDFNDAAQQELVESIQKNGVIQPIIVRKAENGYEIIAGERRWRAAQSSGMKEVPVIIRQATDRELAELSIVENIQREALNPVEEAKAYQLLQSEFSLSQEDIAVRVGKNRTTIANTVRLLKLPTDIQQEIITKKITAGHARALISLEGMDVQRKVFETVKKNDLNVRQTESLIKKLKTNPQVKVPAVNHYLEDVQRQISSQLMTKVKIKQGKKSGAIEIRFTTQKDLDRLIQFLLNR